MISICTCLMFRFDPAPESGESKGLLLVLDGHNDLVASSTVQDNFQVLVIESLQIYIYHGLVTGDGGNSGHKK